MKTILVNYCHLTRKRNAFNTDCKDIKEGSIIILHEGLIQVEKIFDESKYYDQIEHTVSNVKTSKFQIDIKRLEIVDKLNPNVPGELLIKSK